MTKLRLVLGDGDERYLRRLSDYITFHYAERIEIYSFTKPELLAEFIRSGKVNGVFVGKGFTKIKEEIPPQMTFAYLSEGIETEHDESMEALMKYQSADALVKEMLSLCSEQVVEILSGNSTAGGGRMVLFESPMGGAGTTLLAAAYACHVSRNGKKALYLSLEPFGALGGILEGDGRFDFGDAIYALKSKKSNLRLKLESVMRQDRSGACFIEPCRQALDYNSLTKEDALLLFDCLREEGGFDTVILDRGSGLSALDTACRKAADQIVLVVDEGRMQNEKAEKLIGALKIQEEKEGLDLCGKMQVLYNRCRSRCSLPGIQGLPVLGCVPEWSGAMEKKILENMAQEGVLEKLFIG